MTEMLDNGLQLGSEEHMQQVLQSAMEKRQHGPKVLIPGLHGSTLQPATKVTTPSPSAASPATVTFVGQANGTADDLGDIHDTRQVIHPEMSPTVPLPTPAPPTSKVLLTHRGDENSQMTGFDLEMEVTDICVDEESISVALLSTARFKPKAGMRFELKFHGTSYPVCFMGAAFIFPRLNLNGISFIRIAA